MSRILRSPMFRGGPVSSYGTGIASGLADDGRVGLYRSYRGTVGEAAKNMNNKTGSEIFKAALDRSTYFDPAALPGFRNVKREIPIVGGDVSAEKGGQQLGPTDYLVEKGYISDVERPVKDMSMAELIDYQIGEKGDVYQTGSILGGDQNKPREVKSTKDLNEDELLELRTEQAKAATGALDMTGTRPKVKKTESKSELELKLENERLRKLNEELMTGTTDPSTVDTGDLESMIGRYEKILGGDKAKGQDVADMLLTFAGSKGDTTMDKFQEFFATEAKKGPSRTEKIKQAAAMLGIKGEQAQKLYETKLKNTSGQTQKAVEYIAAITGASPKEALRKYLRKESTFAATAGKYKKEEGALTDQGFKFAAEDFYEDEYKGDVDSVSVINADKTTTLPDGWYSDAKNKIMFEVKDKVVISDRSYN